VREIEVSKSENYDPAVELHGELQRLLAFKTDQKRYIVFNTIFSDWPDQPSSGIGCQDYSRCGKRFKLYKWGTSQIRVRQDMTYIVAMIQQDKKENKEKIYCIRCASRAEKSGLFPAELVVCQSQNNDQD